MTEAGVARRNVGLVLLLQGDLIGAQTNLAEALRTYDPERDRDAQFRFSVRVRHTRRRNELTCSGDLASGQCRPRAVASR